MKLRIYYTLKPFIPRSLQIGLRRWIVKGQRRKHAHIWPIDERAAEKPTGWQGWPEGKQFAIVLTHDVDTQQGHDRARQLAELEMRLGFRSAFYFVPERYRVSAELRSWLTERGFEVGVHGLYHDGKYFLSREKFQRRAEKINRYIRKWGAVGYRSPSMQRRLEWFHDLDILYDSSTFDTDPFEPQNDGVCKIFPFFVSKNGTREGFIELPYTLPQDFTSFILMRERTIDIWKRKLDWLAAQGAMALLIVHPDYMVFDGDRSGGEEYPASLYRSFLEYVQSRYGGLFWQALPREMVYFWRLRQCEEQLPLRSGLPLE